MLTLLIYLHVHVQCLITSIVTVSPVWVTVTESLNIYNKMDIEINKHGYYYFLNVYTQCIYKYIDLCNCLR